MTKSTIQENMEIFREELNASGITATTVDLATKAPPSKWKTYYRTKLFSGLGLLVVHPNDDCDLDCQCGKLEDEVENYKLLREAGFMVPEISKPIRIYDTSLEVDAVSLVVEHIDGSPSLKPVTEFRRVKKWATNNLDAVAQRRAEDSWENLRTLTQKRGVQDLQIIISYHGKMFVIDPENTTSTPTDRLPAWSNI